MKDLKPLPQSSPELTGVSSGDILEFLQAIEDQRINLHSYMMIRDNQIIAEGYWKPFHAEFMHRMYSVSKSFVSTAVGMMADEGKISLTDKIVKYFPDKLPDPVHPYIMEMTIRDMLMMATVRDGSVYGDDWTREFFSAEATHKPGSIFFYDTSGSNTLAALVERVSGMPLLDYMRPRLLDRLGFSRDAWCIQTPDGYSFGGSGVICTMRDLAKVALVWLNQGRYQGEQLISENYIKAASTRQIDNVMPAFSSVGLNAGYGYQTWILRDHGFAFEGMGSQLAICYPDKNFLFVCTGDTQTSQAGDSRIIETLWRLVVNKIQSESLPENPAFLRRLEEVSGSLEVLLPEGKPESPLAGKISGKTYVLEPNDTGISKVRLDFSDDRVLFSYTNKTGDKQIVYGLGKYLDGEFPDHSGHYYGAKIGTPASRGYHCMNAAVWVEENKIQLVTNAVDDYFGNLTVSLAFMDNEISLYGLSCAEWFFREYNGFGSGKARQD
ncbi:MAG: serine hydrolase [Clostridiaceae bacterium]|nr:serine hydrolase [Clostridiaceae bacterium]